MGICQGAVCRQVCTVWHFQIRTHWHCSFPGHWTATPHHIGAELECQGIVFHSGGTWPSEHWPWTDGQCAAVHWMKEHEVMTLVTQMLKGKSKHWQGTCCWTYIYKKTRVMQIKDDFAFKFFFFSFQSGFILPYYFFFYKQH